MRKSKRFQLTFKLRARIGRILPERTLHSPCQQVNKLNLKPHRLQKSSFIPPKNTGITLIPYRFPSNRALPCV
jgi:hypothetical protein